MTRSDVLPDSAAQRHREFDRLVVAFVGLTYATLVLLMWAPYTAYSGLRSETVFTYLSETSSPLAGFLYRFDPLRIHTTTFYHLSYLMGDALGIGGSYVPFQFVLASLWWARGFLLFLLARRLARIGPVPSYVAGALVLVHSSDGALQWIGQLNQFGFIFWLLLACYLFVVSLEADTMQSMVAAIVGACLAEYMTLWSYESPIVIVLAFPLITLVSPAGRLRRLVTIAVAWYAVAACYIGLSLSRYLSSGGSTYQATVLRKTWRLGPILSDWWFNIATSLEFWTWTVADWKISEPHAAWLAVSAATVFLVGGVILTRLAPPRNAAGSFEDSGSRWGGILAAGFILIAFSFPVYLLLDSARSMWRTQLLSGIGSGLTLTAMLGLTCTWLIPQRANRFGLVVCSAVIVWFGSFAAIQKGGFERWQWERHRTGIQQILLAAPSVKPNTVILLVNVPKIDDPFSHNMWLDVSVRLAYPDIPVTACYFYEDGTPGPGFNLRIVNHRWTWDGTNYPPLVPDSGVENSIVVDYRSAAASPLVPSIPSFICADGCPSQSYHPASVITSPIARRAAHRYRVNSPPW